MDKKTDVRDPDEKVVEIEMERLRAFDLRRNRRRCPDCVSGSEH